MSLSLDRINISHKGEDDIQSIDNNFQAIENEINSHLADYAALLPTLTQSIPANAYTGDCNDLSTGTIVRILGTAGPNAPGAYCYLWTIRYGTSGFQLAFMYTSGGGTLKFRTLNTNWGGWKTVSAS